jgi:CRISPR-associated protein Cas1
MNNRILDLSSAPARLHVRTAQLLIEPDAGPPVTVPLADIAVLVVAQPQVRYTHAVLSELAAAGGVFVACDRACLPVGMLVPLAGHCLQAERFAAQARASLPLKKRLWRQIVRAKIRAQAQLLADLRGDDRGLAALVSLVRSGDTANVEARASRRYWPALMNSPQFRRRRDGADANRLLNYGYAVLRAIVARAVCAAGLHPSLGLHHHNRYDAFLLADDLMEPLRPLVDRVVAEVVAQRGLQVELDAAVKRDLLMALTGRILVDGQQRTLFDAASRTAVSLADVFLDQADRLTLPESLDLVPF